MGDKSQQQQEQEHCCISHEFYRAASNNLEKIAVIHADGGPGNSRESMNPPVYDEDQCFTFAHLLHSVDSLTSRLRSILSTAHQSQLPTGSSIDSEHVGPSVERKIESKNVYTPKIIGIYMPPSVEYIISVLSVLRCGEAFLPLDPSWPNDRILSIVSTSNAHLVIARGCHPLEKSHWLVDCSSCPLLCFSMDERLERCIYPSSFLWPCENGKHRSFCYLMYTSGSTGKPKGVCGTEQELYPLQEEDLVLFKTAISFIDHLQEFLSAMLTSSTLVIPPSNELKENVFSIVKYVKAYSINRLTAVPSVIRAILPALQSQYTEGVSSSLKLLVLSGEVLPLSLWNTLSELLPHTSVLNLYGSTEVSGDCTFFDCKRLRMILETETLTSVPIGVPIFNCDVVLVGDSDMPTEGEIYVGGLCVSNGYFFESSNIMSTDYLKLHQNSICNCASSNCGSQFYFRTGDFAQRLPSGDLVFLGRKDRTIKLNGQRMALEEIENKLREHTDVVDDAVISLKGHGQGVLLEAFIVLKDKDKCNEISKSLIKSWMVSKLPLFMIPSRFVFKESLPVSSSGKVDYALLECSTSFNTNGQFEICDKEDSDLMQVIKKAFCAALMVEEVSHDDDFFLMGGNSISAAHVSHKLGIDIRLLYNYPTPSNLEMALLEKKVSLNSDANWNLNLEAGNGTILYSSKSATHDLFSLKPRGWLLRTANENNANHGVLSKRLKVNLDKYVTPECVIPRHGCLWNSVLKPVSCSFSRCNQVLCGGDHVMKYLHELTWSVEVPRNEKWSMQELWKVHMDSCVDASPLVVFKDSDIYLFIGSHSNKFLCIDAKSGSVEWEIKLEGRVECSAAIVANFSQVVVGCYKGNIYFLDFLNGQICWTFQTSGEVKSQPVVDKHKQLIWCGSHDHNLYALDYIHHCCVYKLPCGGSIYGSPAIDEGHGKLYVASTSGRLTAISIKAFPFYTLWVLELQVPVFGSLSICPPNGNVICCLVDGQVVALDSTGSIIWRYRTGGPVFAGACISNVLPTQVLICCRNGSVYSFEMVKGNLLWEYNAGNPITASAYVDEHLKLVYDPLHLSDRLLCVCTSTGSLYLLRIELDLAKNAIQPRTHLVQEFARLDLQGDIFSSPVMIGGRIFVGCRDDYLHCIAVDT
ncbi:AMP-binding domain-containing protein/PQQ_2 domain-containing protein [Cephalotus follicularis]|uniref:AMP-binding domain-containing protein/PQQ_2 domain-containing protein n=1 Tax=Cephalotus follicularis TaxID=3775 RepID=A0A1Q3DH56_CEPFO|nr:AMP-binding domain-containing protein/PQQ_2 domain-containing protein [Cephalotus follicularis]